MRSRSWKPHIPAGRRNWKVRRGRCHSPTHRRAREGKGLLRYPTFPSGIQGNWEKDLRSTQAAGSPFPWSHRTRTEPELCDCSCTPARSSSILASHRPGGALLPKGDPGLLPSLTQGGSVQQTIPIASGGQGQQTLAARIHRRPPVETPWGDLGERETEAQQGLGEPGEHRGAQPF